MNSTKPLPLVPLPLILFGISIIAMTLAFLDLQREAFIVVGGVMVAVFFGLKPEYGILTFLATFLFSYPSFLRGSGFVTPNNLLGLLFCFLLLNRIYHDGKIWFFRVRQIQWLVAIGVIFLLATWQSSAAPSYLVPLDRTRIELWNYFSQFAFLIFFIHFIRTKHHLNLVFGLLLFVIVCSIPSAIQSALLGMGDYRASATFGINMAKNSNHLAFYCLFGVTTLWYIRQALENPLIKMLVLGLMGVLILCIFLTASRNALINLILLSLIFSFEAGFNFRHIFLTLVIVVSLTTVAFQFIPEKNLERITAFSISPSQKEASQSISERRNSLKAAFKVLRDSKFLGVGPGNFRWIRQVDYDHKRVATHNAYVWALVTGGIPALLCFLGLFFSTWQDLRWLEVQKFSSNLPPMWMVKTIRTTLLLFLIFSLFTEAWLEIIPFLLVGITIVMKRCHLQQSEGNHTT